MTKPIAILYEPDLHMNVQDASRILYGAGYVVILGGRNAVSVVSAPDAVTVTTVSEVANWELDALVGEKVMGWARVKDDPETPFMDPFHPSTNIADAWRVVEHFTANGQSLSLEWSPGGWMVDNYTNESIPGPGWNWDSEPCWTCADTAPEAICRAALKAVGVEMVSRQLNDAGDGAV